MSFGYVHKVSL